MSTTLSKETDRVSFDLSLQEAYLISGTLLAAGVVCFPNSGDKIEELRQRLDRDIVRVEKRLLLGK